MKIETRSYINHLIMNFCKIFILLIGVFFPVRLHFDKYFDNFFSWCFITNFINVNCLDFLLIFVFIILSIKFLDINLYYQKRKN